MCYMRNIGRERGLEMYRTEWIKRSLSVGIVLTMFSISSPLVFAELPTASPLSPATPQMADSSAQMNSQQTNNAATQGQSYVIPQGTKILYRTTTPLPSNLGEIYTGQVVDPIAINGETVIPQGSEVKGTIVAVYPNTMQVQFHQVSTPDGEIIPIQGTSTVDRLYGQVQTQQVAPSQGTLSGIATYYPQVTFGPHQLSPAGKIVAGTVGGALFGGATGALVGLVMPAVYRDSINFGEGTGAARGLAWGAAMGAGLGLASGLIAAAATRKKSCVTTTVPLACAAPPLACAAPAPACSAPAPACAVAPLTNIGTTYVNQTPVAYPLTGQVVQTGPIKMYEYTMTLNTPVTVTH